MSTELCCEDSLQETVCPSHHTVSKRTALAEGRRTNTVQDCHPHVQMCARKCSQVLTKTSHTTI